MTTFKMAVPSGFPNTYVAKDGSTYTQSGGFIAAVSAEDVNDLEAMGCHVVDETTGLGARCTTQVDRATSTTLTDITGLSVPLEAGGVYTIEAVIFGVATANGGAKAALAADSTLTATSCSYRGEHYNGATLNAATTTTTLGNAVGAATAVMTCMKIVGTIVVNAAGSLKAQIAQNASHADTTSAYVNSYMKATRIA